MRPPPEWHVCLRDLRSSGAPQSCFWRAIISESSLSTTTTAMAVLAFASEVKALLEVPGIDASIDPESLDQYLTFLWVPDPETLFEGIFKLPAGHSALFRKGGEFKIEQYWDLTFRPPTIHFERTEADLADEIRERFCASVDRQMVSDVPIGAFLSAGLDSSSIVAAMSRKQPVRTYTITFPEKYRVGENALDDPEVAATVGAQAGLRTP